VTNLSLGNRRWIDSIVQNQGWNVTPIIKLKSYAMTMGICELIAHALETNSLLISGSPL